MCELQTQIDAFGNKCFQKILPHNCSSLMKRVGAAIGGRIRTVMVVGWNKKTWFYTMIREGEFGCMNIGYAATL